MANKKNNKQLNIALPKIETKPSLVGVVVSRNFDGTKTISVEGKMVVAFPDAGAIKAGPGDKVQIDRYPNGEIKRLRQIN